MGTTTKKDIDWMSAEAKSLGREPIFMNAAGTYTFPDKGCGYGIASRADGTEVTSIKPYNADAITDKTWQNTAIDNGINFVVDVPFTSITISAGKLTIYPMPQK